MLRAAPENRRELPRLEYTQARFAHRRRLLPPSVVAGQFHSRGRARVACRNCYAEWRSVFRHSPTLGINMVTVAMEIRQNAYTGRRTNAAIAAPGCGCVASTTNVAIPGDASDASASTLSTVPFRPGITSET